MNLTKFSRIVSGIFNYYTWASIALVVGIFKTGLTAGQIRLVFPLTTTLDLIIPILVYLFLIKTGRISDSSLIKREDRSLLFGVSCGFVLIATVLSFFLANELFFKLHVLMFTLFLTTFLITLFFKISGHLIMNTSFPFILNFLLGWNLLWIFSVVPLVAFARLYLKAHTWKEVLSGAVVGLGEPYLILKIFRLL